MFSQLRKYEVQARYALVLSIAAAAPLVASIALLLRNYQHDARQVIYRSDLYSLAFVMSAGLAMLIGAAACVLGWNSAGQRRNDAPAHSWIGFFVGGAAVTLAAIVLLAFVMLRLKQAH